MKRMLPKIIAVLFLILFVSYVMLTEAIPWRSGSLLSIYNAEELQIQSCTAIDTGAAMQSEVWDGVDRNTSDPDGISVIQDFLTLDWKPAIFSSRGESARTIYFILYISFQESDLSFLIDFIDPTTIRISVRGLPSYRRSTCLYTVKDGYDVDAIKAAVGLLSE